MSRARTRRLAVTGSIFYRQLAAAHGDSASASQRGIMADRNDVVEQPLKGAPADARTAPTVVRSYPV